jgi:DNA-binding FrmR family transcriptional regulator
MDKAIVHRVSRLQGQLDTLKENITADQACEEVIPQLLAVRGAVQALTAAYLKTALTSCDRTDAAKLDRLIELVSKT